MSTRPSPLPIVWTDRAIRELEAIGAYIESFNVLAAQRRTRRLIAAAETLAEHPGRFRSEGVARELVVIKPYVIRYRVTRESVIILRVRHGARRPLRT